MSDCYDEGQLRAYLDGELAHWPAAALADHLAGCQRCRAELAAQRAAIGRVRALLPAPPPPSPVAALGRALAAAHETHAAGAPAPANARRSIMRMSTLSNRRGTFAALAAVIALASLLALPPVRAAADQLLSVFRVQKVVFVPVDRERIEQLRNLKVDPSTLFVGKPEHSDGAPPQTAATAAEAAQLAGFAPSELGSLPSGSQPAEYSVSAPKHASFTLNIPAAQQVLDTLGIDDVSLPEAAGASPISVDFAPLVSTRYSGGSYDLELHQGPSPNVAMPEGVELADLGRAALRVLGMNSAQAELASRQINWNTTLLFPFPADTQNIRQVTVAGEQGLLLSGGPRGNGRAMLYWQSGERFYMLEVHGQGMGDQELVDAALASAESLR
jgi:hypothetical protein